MSTFDRPDSPSFAVPPLFVSSSFTPIQLPTQQRQQHDHCQPEFDFELESLHPQDIEDTSEVHQLTSEASYSGHTRSSTFELDEDTLDQDPMKRQTRSHAAVSADTSDDAPRSPSMEFPSHRRKYSAVDGSTAAAQLMSRETFTLDHDPLMPTDPTDASGSGVGFWGLPVQDRKNFLVLVLLYFLQGIPMGLATGSVPFLLKEHLSYGQIGIFTLASYPYSLKLLWSPIVDAVWSPRLGRRKSWILPIQAFSGLCMLWLGGRIKGMMHDAGSGGDAAVWGFTAWWFFLVFTCATQDIAVDGMSKI